MEDNNRILATEQINIEVFYPIERHPSKDDDILKLKDQKDNIEDENVRQAQDEILTKEKEDKNPNADEDVYSNVAETVEINPITDKQ